MYTKTGQIASCTNKPHSVFMNERNAHSDWNKYKTKLNADWAASCLHIIQQALLQNCWNIIRFETERCKQSTTIADPFRRYRTMKARNVLRTFILRQRSSNFLRSKNWIILFFKSELYYYEKCTYTVYSNEFSLPFSLRPSYIYNGILARVGHHWCRVQ